MMDFVGYALTAAGLGAAFWAFGASARSVDSPIEVWAASVFPAGCGVAIAGLAIIIVRSV